MLDLVRCSARFSFLLLAFGVSGSAWSLGLGEMHGEAFLGQPLSVTVDLIGVDRQSLDASCFRLVPPSGGGDIPWLKRASFDIRRSALPVVEIRSSAPLREPVLQIALQVTCGLEVSREYVLLASPAKESDAPTARTRVDTPVAVAEAPRKAESEKKRSLRAPVLPEDTLPRVAPPSRGERSRRPARLALPDRLMLSEGGDVGDPSLRLSTELLSPAREAGDLQRDMLRLEFKMLMALQEQATNQLATAEKLRNMEETLAALKEKAADFAGRVEKDGAPAAPVSVADQPRSAAPTPEKIPERPSHAVEQESGLSEWTLYAALAGGVLGLLGWLGWKSRRDRKLEAEVMPSQNAPVDPRRLSERDGANGVDLAFEPQSSAAPTALDFDLGTEDSASGDKPHGEARRASPDSIMSIQATSVDEHFEANPVMELADIMLSFGRVKGAAQALQEYIDNNPQEALQPWIRLMEVYRMAGMRDEFEAVSRNLNQHFNVAIQHWGEQADSEVAAESDQPVAPQATGLEDIPRLMNMVVELWGEGDVVGYLYQLLRDNRGGGRQGFTLPVVDDIMFLIELKETANRMVHSL